MKLVTLRYTSSKGWEIPFPALDSPQTLVIVFGSPKFLNEPDRVQELTQAYPESHIVGCSTAGEILGTEITDDSLVVAVIRFDATPITSVVLPIGEAGDSFQVGVEIAQKLASPQLKGIMVFSEGVIINGTQLIAGLNSVLPPSVVITGGLAGDGPRFERTWILEERYYVTQIIDKDTGLIRWRKHQRQAARAPNRRQKADDYYIVFNAIGKALEE